MSDVAGSVPGMAHHWTPMQMVTRTRNPDEWICGDRRETLGVIRRVHVDSVETFVCVTKTEMVIAGGDTLKDAALEFVKWSQARKRGR